MLTLHDYLPSQNGYKVRLLLNLLQVPYRLREVNVFRGESSTPEFLKMNPAGRIPVLQLDSGECLPESNAILFYLSEGTEFLPTDRFERAQALQWMFFEQYCHEPTIAVLRYWVLAKRPSTLAEELRTKLEGGYDALEAMENRLRHHDYLAGNRYSIADISLFAYTSVAHEAGFEMSRFTGIARWLERIRSHPRHLNEIHYYDPVDVAGIWNTLDRK